MSGKNVCLIADDLTLSNQRSSLVTNIKSSILFCCDSELTTDHRSNIEQNYSALVSSTNKLACIEMTCTMLKVTFIYCAQLQIMLKPDCAVVLLTAVTL